MRKIFEFDRFSNSIENRNYITCDDCHGNGELDNFELCNNCDGEGKYVVMLDTQEILNFKRNEKIFQKFITDLRGESPSKFMALDGIYEQTFVVKSINEEGFKMIYQLILDGFSVSTFTSHDANGGLEFRVKRDMDK